LGLDDDLLDFFRRLVHLSSPTIQSLKIPFALIDTLPSSIPNLKSLKFSDVESSFSRSDPLSAASLLKFAPTLKSLTMSSVDKAPHLTHKPDIGMFPLLEEVHIGLVNVKRDDDDDADLSHIALCRAVRKAASPLLTRLLLFDAINTDDNNDGYADTGIDRAEAADLVRFAFLNCFVRRSTYLAEIIAYMKYEDFKILVSYLGRDPEAFNIIVAADNADSFFKQEIRKLLFDSPTLLADPECIIRAFLSHCVEADREVVMTMNDVNRAQLQRRWQAEHRPRYMDALAKCGRRGSPEVSEDLVRLLCTDFVLGRLSGGDIGSFHSPPLFFFFKSFFSQFIVCCAETLIRAGVIDLFDQDITSHMVYLLALIMYWEPFYHHFTSTCSPPLLHARHVIVPHVSHAVYRGLLFLFALLTNTDRGIAGFIYDPKTHLWRDATSKAVVCDASPQALLHRAASIGLDPHARASGCNVFSREVDMDKDERSLFRVSIFSAEVGPFQCSELLLALAYAGVDCASIDRDGNTLLHRIASSEDGLGDSQASSVAALVQLCRQRYDLSFFAQNKRGVTAIGSFKSTIVENSFLRSSTLLTEEEKRALRSRVQSR
jgi:hypothetical protein